jgi:N-acetylmuramoyl-L-alanine amidase
VRAWVLVLSLLTGGLAAAPVAADPPARVSSVRIAEEEGRTRVVIESNKELKYNVFFLASGARRIVVDLPKVRWTVGGLTTESGTGAGGGAVAAIRYAHNTATSSRLVLDLAEPVSILREFAMTPRNARETYRIVMDLEPSTGAKFAASAETDRAPPTSSSRQAARKPLVVIDPGHGGKDPGSSAADETREKDVTLAIALALREEILKSGRYDVALTRETDVFIELEDRVTKARTLGADLFISLHADAGPNSLTRGASVYTLSSDGERRAEAARQKHDWVLAVETDASRPVEVNQILADLVTRETKNQSARFAQALVPALADAGWPALQNTHRRRGFYVLLGPDVPAVLLEMGFMTNAQDAAMLASEKKRGKLVRGVAQAIDAFFESQTQLVAMR